MSNKKLIQVTNSHQTGSVNLRYWDRRNQFVLEVENEQNRLSLIIDPGDLALLHFRIGKALELWANKDSETDTA